MSNSVTINTETAKELVSSIRELKAEITSLKKIILNPRYGSNAWWERELEIGENEIKEGNYKTYKDAKSLISNLS